MLNSSLVILLFVCIFLQSQANYCADHNIAWTGYDVKVIDDCEILQDHVIVHLDQLTKRLNCFE